MIDSTFSSICHSLNRLENDDSDPEMRECYHFQNLSVLPEALLQMALAPRRPRPACTSD